jgi:aspartate/methionine/tyrosine aminotransferase
MKPRLVVKEKHLNPVVSIGAGIPQNQMFDLRTVLRYFIQENPEAEIYDASQGDGGASLPGVPKDILELAHKMLLDNGTGYGQPHGTESFRRTVVEDYWQLDFATNIGPANVASCCGGRDALLKAYKATQELGGALGSFVVTTSVPWISYNWGPYCVGANVMLAPGIEGDGWSLTPDAIKACASYARDLSRDISCLVITSPDNPTGRYTTLEEQIVLIKAAFESGVKFVLLDWMYHWVSDYGPYDLNALLLSFPLEERQRIIVLDGVTKSLGGSNIRNAHLIAGEDVIDHIRFRASHGVIPSFHGEAVAAAAYKIGYAKASWGIVGPTSQSRRVLDAFTKSHGIKTILDQGYYGFLNVEPWIKKKGMKDSAELGIWLAKNHGLAIVPGYYFNEEASGWIRFSYALQPEDTLKTAIRLYQLLEL